jgi:hypothetical protein
MIEIVCQHQVVFLACLVALFGENKGGFVYLLVSNVKEIAVVLKP